MRAWDQLIEARIRDWQTRKQRGEAQPAASAPVDSLESQLFDEVVKLRRRAAEQKDPARERALLEEAERLRIRLAVLLEKHGFHLLAKSLDERIEAELRSAEQPDE